MAFRHQLAAYSPVTAGAVLSGTSGAFGIGADPRLDLAGVLSHDYGADEVVLCGSGTQALQLAIQIAACRRADESTVALPAFSCFDVAAAAVGAGLPIALYDIDPVTLGPDAASLERTLAAGARICVIATLYGVPCDFEPLETLATAYGATLIEDAAQGHGASFNGRPLGTLAQLSTLSFGRGKGWTGGSGGALLLRGSAASIPRQVLRAAPWGAELRGIAVLLAQWVLGRPGVYGLPRSIPALKLGETTYHEPRPPVAMTRVASKAALANRAASAAEGRRRRETARHILAALPTPGTMTVRIPPGAEAGYLRFPIRSTRSVERIGSHPAARRLGLERSYPCTLGDLDVVRRRLVGPDSFWPGAKSLVERLLTAPTHSLLTDSERAAVAAILCDLGS